MIKRTLITAALFFSFCGVGMAQGDYLGDPTQYVIGGKPWSVFCADFNGDGYADVATVSYQTDSLTVLLNSGSGTFLLSATYLAGDMPVSVYGADVDADDDIDLAVANYLANTLSLFLNNGDGTFAPPSTIAAGVYPTSVLLADLNGDTSPDLVATNERVTMPFMDDFVSVMFNNGDGTFQDRVSKKVGVCPQKSVAVDLDGNGSLDLAVVNLEGHNVSVMLNDGSGTFSTRVNYESHHMPTDISVADLDGDGDIDLIAPNSDAYDRSVVSVILNNGDGSFQPTVYYSSGGYPYATFANDLDKDGDIDIIVANWMTDSLSILLNNGNATFQAPIQYVAGDSPTSLYTADFDHDTYDDLAVGNRNSNDLLVYMNQGTASHVGDDISTALPVAFRLAQNSPNPFNPDTRIEYDLARSGWVELAVFDILGRKVTTLVDGFRAVGSYQAVWDGAGSNGKPVATGIYFYRLRTGALSETRKMVLLR